LTGFAIQLTVKVGGIPMATMNISLPDPMKNWIEEHLKDGTFSNSSDYLRHLIRKDQERTVAIKMLQQEIEKGIQSGEPEPFDLATFKNKMKEKYVR